MDDAGVWESCNDFEGMESSVGQKQQYTDNPHRLGGLWCIECDNDNENLSETIEKYRIVLSHRWMTMVGGTIAMGFQRWK